MVEHEHSTLLTPKTATGLELEVLQHLSSSEYKFI